MKHTYIIVIDDFYWQYASLGLYCTDCGVVVGRWEETEIDLALLVTAQREHEN